MWFLYRKLQAVSGALKLGSSESDPNGRYYREKVEGLKRGDEVITAGGLVGKITKVEEHYVELELAKGMKVRAVKSTIGEVLSGKPAAPAND